MTKKRIKIASAKAKGRNLQKWVANQISELINIPVEKDGDVESRPMGQPGTDIILRGKAKKLFPYSIECKNTEVWNINSAITQAKSQLQYNKKDKNWLCFFKKNQMPPIVIMNHKKFDFLKVKNFGFTLAVNNKKGKNWKLEKCILEAKKDKLYDKNIKNWLCCFTDTKKLHEKKIAMDAEFFFTLLKKDFK